MRRKILSFILALTLMAGMGSIAYAEGTTNKWNGSTGGKQPRDIEVYGTYEDSKPAPKYCINIAWEDMTFNCTIEDNRTWNPVTHEYGGVCSLRIESNAKDVTVTNRSNADVKVEATVAQADPMIQGVKLFLQGATTGDTEIFTLGNRSSGSMNIIHHLTVGLSETGELDPDQFKEKNPEGNGSVTKAVGTVTITVSDPNKEQSP